MKTIFKIGIKLKIEKTVFAFKSLHLLVVIACTETNVIR